MVEEKTKGKSIETKERRTRQNGEEMPDGRVSNWHNKNDRWVKKDEE